MPRRAPSPVLIHAERLEAGFNRSLEWLATNATVGYSNSTADVVRASVAYWMRTAPPQCHGDGRGAGPFPGRHRRWGGAWGVRVSYGVGECHSYGTPWKAIGDMIKVT